MGERVELVDRTGPAISGFIDDANTEEPVARRNVVGAHDERDLALAEIGLDIGGELHAADPDECGFIERGPDLTLHVLGHDRRPALVILVHLTGCVVQCVGHFVRQHHLGLHQAIDPACHVGVSSKIQCYNK